MFLSFGVVSVAAAQCGRLGHLPLCPNQSAAWNSCEEQVEISQGDSRCIVNNVDLTTGNGSIRCGGHVGSCAGYYWSWGPYQYIPGKNIGTPGPCCSAGDPINIGTGNEHEKQQDYAAPGSLNLDRYYNSDALTASSHLGAHWRHSFDRTLQYVSSGGKKKVTAFRSDGKQLLFNKVNGVWLADSDIHDTLIENDDAQQHIVGWSYFVADTQQIEFYDAIGLLTSIEDLSGQHTTLSYSDASTPSSIAPAPNLLITVTDSHGRQLNFTYDSSSRIDQITLPNGSALGYGYDASNNLSTVTYPGSAVRTYKYNESGHVAVSLPNALTGIVDENAVRYADIHYDSSRAISSQLGGIADLTQVAYNQDGTTTVTYPLGVQSTFGLAIPLGMIRVSTVSDPCSPACGQNASSRTFDANGSPESTTDFNANTTSFIYDNAGLETQRIEAHGTSVQRTINSQWDVLRNPVSRNVLDANGNLTIKTDWAYNIRGQLLARCEDDPTVAGATSYVCTNTGIPSAGVRRTTYTYCDTVDGVQCPLIGLLLSVDGPRTDISEITQFSYYVTTDESSCGVPGGACHRVGDLWKVTNPLGQTTEILKYSGAGRPLSVEDANGVIIDYEYHPRGWLTASKVRGTNDATETDDLITQIEYWPTGLVKKVTQPDGAFTAYTYDTAHRLTDIADNAGNSIHYALDSAGNITQEDTKDSVGTLKRTLSRVYSQLGKMETLADADANPIDFTYDFNGNTTTVTDALGHVSSSDYDPLNRLVRTLQDAGGIAAETKFEYDPLDNLAKVTDPKGLDTTYFHDGFGDLTQVVSPDTGITSYSYDSAGNRETQTDARGKVSTFAYDALNRLTNIGYASSGLNVTYTYDIDQGICSASEKFSVGRLTKMKDGSGTTKYCYDRFGRLVRKRQTSKGKNFTVQYAYTKASQLSSITYPDGSMVDYVRDGEGQITEVGVTPNGDVRQVLLSQASYYPFGPVAGWTYGNGRSMIRSLNQNYQPETILDSGTDGLSLNYDFNAVGNLVELKDGLQSGILAQYGYDALNRVSDTNDGPTGTTIEHYDYDATGNRLGVTNAGFTSSYTYPANSHRLTSVAGVTRTYDAAGNTTKIGGAARQFVYDATGRMSKVKASGTVTMNYKYNGRGERVRRFLNTSNTYTVYDESGHWLGDYDSAGAPIQQAIWLDDLPVGLLAGAGSGEKLHYVEPDHLGSPRVVIDPVRDVAVWEWNAEGEAFGDTPPDQDPDADGTAFEFDMRFPGQRYDAVSGLNQNGFRDYDTTTGRYTESDPIGQPGGIALFGYGYANPLRYEDFFGLSSGCRIETEYDGGYGLTGEIRKSGVGGLKEYKLCIPVPVIASPGPIDIIPDLKALRRGLVPFGLPMAWGEWCKRKFVQKLFVERRRTKHIVNYQICTDDCGNTTKTRISDGYDEKWEPAGMEVKEWTEGWYYNSPPKWL